MPKLTVAGQAAEVEQGTRLVLAIEGTGVEIGHRCGGHARCTTCRVVFADGEPATMTRAEYDKLSERGLLGQYRLSCQIVCDHDMVIAEVAMTRENQGWTDTGPEPAPVVTPEATFFPKESLAG
jgi:ferredoxin